jgi:RES domain-containing protein
MTVFRITTEQWSKQLTASGYPARWNSRGNFIIYTAQSRALACLENLVHRSGEGNNALFKVMVIEVPDSIKVDVVDIKTLKKDWYAIANYAYCQSIGNQWVIDAKTAVMKIPSAVIKQEYNYLLNPNHPDFKKIKLSGTEPFNFDERF